jgi:proline iminopeptidase
MLAANRMKGDEMHFIERPSPLANRRVKLRIRVDAVCDSYRAINRRGRLVLALGVGALTAGALVLLMPRGPISAGQALSALFAALALGAATGYIMRSRWAMLLAPLIVALAFELRWVWLDGPTVDLPRFDTSYGILAIILGRGFFFLVCTVPMLAGATIGAALARRQSGFVPSTRLRSKVARNSRRTVTALAVAGVAAMVFFIARPGTTPPITDANGDAVAGSIATLEKVHLPGGDQWISIRGYSQDNPVLLYLHGGPGQSGMPFTRFIYSDIAKDFVVVDWDQRGNGKSMTALDPTSTYTLDGIVEDAAALSRYLAQRFDERKIYLAGTSWGSTLGVLTIQRHPDLFYAFIGGGQMVSQRETDARIYDDLMAFAERTGDSAVVDKLHDFGPPPYGDIYGNAYVMERYEALEPDYTLIPMVEKIGDEHHSEIGPFGVLGREYNLVEKVNVLRGLMETFAVVYPQLQQIDFRRDVPRLDVPVYMFRGTSELAARDDLAVEWFSSLQAPRKHMYLLDHAGHAVLTERPDRLREVLRETVLPETYEGVQG